MNSVLRLKTTVQRKYLTVPSLSAVLPMKLEETSEKKQARFGKVFLP
jgi:hypothetical protein